MAKSDGGALRQWALKGAAARLQELAAERTEIYREFPQLRRRGGATADEGHGAQAGNGAATVERPRRRKRRMSSAQRKAVSERMRSYWAARRAGRSQ